MNPVSCGVTSLPIHFQNTETSPFLHFDRTQRNLQMYNPFTDYINQIQNDQTVANQPNRSNDHTRMLNKITTTVPSMSRPSLFLLNIVDTYSLSSTSNNFFKQILI